MFGRTCELNMDTEYYEGDLDSFKCSNCGWEGYLDDGYPKQTIPNFCPNCGAKVVVKEVSDGDGTVWVPKRICKVTGVYDYGDWRGQRVYALSCGHEFEWNDTEPPRYCPECGAKVVKE